MKLKDFKGIFKKSKVIVESINNPYGDYYEIRLKPTNVKTWSPGEHGIFTLPNHKVDGKKRRGFSLASVEEEGYILLGTRTGKEISSFKEHMLSMKKGDQIAMRGPFGWFKIQDSSTPIVMIAAGVGITPIRALLKQLSKDQSRPVEVVYASSEFYLFEDEIQTMVNHNKRISLHKTVENNETSEKVSMLADKYKDGAYYYISGSVPFIKAMKKQITEAGVNKKRVINDPFFGY